jgi:hypothetical protein
MLIYFSNSGGSVSQVYFTLGPAVPEVNGALEIVVPFLALFIEDGQ